MKDQLCATIIPFPVRVEQVRVQPAEPMANVVSPPMRAAAVPNRKGSDLSQSSQRLTMALANLSAALADQKEATLRWKAAIEDLSAKMRALDETEFGQKKIS